MEKDDNGQPAKGPPSPEPRSRIRRTLNTLRTPFRSGSPFHIASAIKRTGSTKSNASDGEVTRDDHAMRKKNKKQRGESASGKGATETSAASRSTDSSPGSTQAKKEGFVRRLGSLTRKRGEGSSGTSTPPAEAIGDLDPLSDPEFVSPEPPASASSEPLEFLDPHATSESNEDVESSSPIAVEHPVDTRPFMKTTWRRKSIEPEMEKPIEEPSPENATRRRIAFVAQASACLSEDRDDAEGEEQGGGAVDSLEQAVELAKVRLAPRPARTPSTHSRDNDTEEEGLFVDAMPAYGDLLQGITPSVSTRASSPGAERREHLYKILVIGELGTGKTSIIKRYVHQFFSQHYRATIGVDFALKVLNWDASTIIRLQLWDIAGQERFGNMTRVYYKEAVGAFIVFDVSRTATFDAVVKWKNDLDSKVQLADGSPIPCVLLANKCDQQKEGLINQPAKMDEFCREKGFSAWFETSAKENINIEEAARSLVNKILQNDKLLHSTDKDGDQFSLEHKIGNGDNPRKEGKNTCAC